MKRARKPKRAGSAIVLVLVAVVLLMVVGKGLLDLGFYSRAYAIRSASEISARCAADAGLAKALYEMNNKLNVEPWDETSLPQAMDETLANSDAVFSYTVTGDSSAGFSVSSVGKAGWAEKTVISNFKLRGPFEWAIFGKEGVILYSAALVDWYNYDSGDKPLQIGTGSIVAQAIELKNNAFIRGDVLVGVGGNPAVVIRDYGATVTGDIYAMTEEYELPAVTVPQWLQALPDGGTIKSNKTISSSGKYSEIDLKNGKKLTINGQVFLYVTGDITLGNSAEIQVVNDDDSYLILYLGEEFEGKNGSNVNNETQDAKKLIMYGLDTCESIIFKNSSDFYGAIYAPNADVEMNNSADAYGAVVAKTFEQKNSATFNYDVSLRQADTDDEAVRFVVTQWREQ